MFSIISEHARSFSGSSAWLFGKGPSLDTFDMQRAGNLRICINESLIRVPNPTYFFAHDEKPIQRVATDWPAGCTGVLETSRAQFAVSCGVPSDDLICYDKHQLSAGESLEQFLNLPGRKTLVGISGTVHSAIHFCKLIGVAHISLVGFDGAGDYAPSLNLAMPVGGGQHDRIRKDSIRLMDALGLEYEFRADLMNPASSSLEYGQLYDRLREHGYHEAEDNTSHLEQHLPWIDQHLDVGSALDIGCSTGMSLSLLEDIGIEAKGVEVSPNAVARARELGRSVFEASATSLPFPDEAFDLVCSADVFEHLHPDDVEQACREAIRVAKRFVFMKIAEKEDATVKWKDLAGHPLHLTTHPIEWWKTFFRPYGEFIRSEPELFCLRKHFS